MNFLRGSSDKWKELNPVLEDGQPGFERHVTINLNNGDKIELENISLYSESNNKVYSNVTGTFYISDSYVINNRIKVKSEDNSIEGYINIYSVNDINLVGSETFKLKIGDGITYWNDLPYIGESSNIENLVMNHINNNDIHVTLEDKNRWNSIDISNKLDKDGDSSNTYVKFEVPEERKNLSSGSELSILFGNISKWFSDLKNVAFTGSYNDLYDVPEEYKHPNYEEHSIGFYKFSNDSLGHISNISSVTKKDITDLGIPSQDTTYTGGNSDYGDIYIDDNNTIFILTSVGMRTDINPTSEIFNDYSNNTASGVYSRASGTGCHTSGNWASSGGALCNALGDGSFAYGYGIKTSGYCQTAFGQYNENGNYIFEIGNGVSNSNRSNAFSVDSKGNIIAQGSVTALKYIGANATEEEQGLMSPEAVIKLNSLKNYIHPEYTSYNKGLYNIKTDSLGHILEASLVTKLDITSLGIPGQDTTYTAGTGLSLSGTTINHKNSVAAKTAAGFLKLKYDAQGHITGSSGVTKDDIIDLGIPADDTNTEYIVLRGSVKTNSGHIGGANSLLLVDKSNYDKENEVLTSTNGLSICDINPHITFFENHYMNPEYTAYPMFYHVEKSGEKSGIQSVVSSGKIRINQNLDGFDVDGNITASKFIGANATKTEQGLMSAADKTKLDNIADNANNYVHPTTSGNKHIPSGGSSGQILRWSADGMAVWGDDKDTKYSNATQSASGLMSAADKTKLDGIATGANKTVVDTALSSTSTNPVQNKVVKTALDGKAPSSHTHSQYYDSSISRTANTVLAAPNGSAGSATFRKLVSADLPDLSSKYLPLSGGTMTGTVSSSKVTSTYLSGNQGVAIINSTASAGSYVMLAKMNSTNGKFTTGAYKGKYLLQYTSNTTISAETNAVDKSVTLLDESGNSSFPGTVTASAFSGNASSATKLATARNINGLSFDGTANRVNYGSCSTAAATAAKTVACAGFALVTGAEITVKFTVTNTASSPTLNVNSTGAKAIYYRGSAISAGYLAANRTYTFRYNGTQYELVGDINTNTNNYVLQSASTTANYRPLLMGYANSTDTSTLGTSYTNQAYANTAIYAQPSTGSVYATTFVGALTGNASSATKVYSTNTSPSSSTIYYIPFHSNASSENKSLLNTNGMSVQIANGTASAVGSTYLYLGNNIAGGTAGNKVGRVYLYGSGSGYTSLTPANSGSTNYTITIPAATGTIALTSNLHTHSTKTTNYGTLTASSNQLSITSAVGMHTKGKTYTYNNTSYSGSAKSEIFNDYTNNMAAGDYAHVEGSENKGLANCCHVEGWKNVASGYQAHAGGTSSTASGEGSFVHGYQCTAATQWSVAIGSECTSSNSNCAFTFGWGLTNLIGNSTVVGQWNSQSKEGYFVVGKGTSGAKANAFRVASDGKTYATGAYSSTGADYAEMFEWMDGNPDEEDRRGRFVTLDSEKIKFAESADDDIIGVVSAAASIIGDAYEDNWNGMYLTDIFGGNLYDDTIIDDDGNKHVYQTLNPDYDPDVIYVPRSERSEWDAVGMMGKLVVIDDGTCKENEYCIPTTGGIATKSNNKLGFRVLSRLDNTHIKILLR